MLERGEERGAVRKKRLNIRSVGGEWGLFEAAGDEGGTYGEIFGCVPTDLGADAALLGRLKQRQQFFGVPLLHSSFLQPSQHVLA